MIKIFLKKKVGVMGILVIAGFLAAFALFSNVLPYPI